MEKVISYRHKARSLPNELLVMYRHRSGLTQNQLANHLGFKTERMVQKWESGYTLPTAERLQSLIKYYLETGIFIAENEHQEASELWRVIKDMFDLNSVTSESYPIFDENWFAELLDSCRPPKTTLLPQSQPDQVNTPEDTQRWVSAGKPALAGVPTPTNRLIGRAEEVKAVKTLLALKNQAALTVRLLTLTGAGGTGKTRLAIQVATELSQEQEFEQILFVDLTPVHQPELLFSKIAATFGLTPTSGLDPLQLLQDFFAARRVLLVLDNFEHLLAAGPQVSQLLLNCPNLTILVTSRVALQLTGEYEFQVRPLKVPPKNLILAKENYPTLLTEQYPALALFVERAQAVKPSFIVEADNIEGIVEICQHLDGLPLAIELAAAWIKMLSPQNLALRLINNHTHLQLAMLATGGADLPERQKTIYASIDWSFNLLTPAEQTLLRRLSVFNGGWELEAAEEICAGDGLEQRAIMLLLYQLINHSLVVVEEQPNHKDTPRFRLLETIREYSLMLLKGSGEELIFRQRHLEFFVNLAGRSELMMVCGQEFVGIIRQFDREHNNLVAALEWAFAQGEQEMALKLSSGAAYYWYLKGYWNDGQRWLAAALAASPSPGLDHAKALLGQAMLFGGQEDLEQSRLCFEESLQLFRQLGKARYCGYALTYLSWVQARLPEPDKAVDLNLKAQAIFTELGDGYGLSQALIIMGDLYIFGIQNNKQAQPYVERALELKREIGDNYGLARVLNLLAWLTEETAQKLAYVEKSLAIQREMDDKGGLAGVLSNRGLLSLYAKGQNYAEAIPFFQESLTLYRELGNRAMSAWCLNNIGRSYLYLKDYKQAAFYLTQSLQLRPQKPSNRHNLHCVTENIEALAGVSAGIGQAERAARLFGAADEWRSNLIRIPLDEKMQRPYEHTIEPARALLGEEDFTFFWQQGQAMSFEEAIKEAEQVGSEANPTETMP